MENLSLFLFLALLAEILGTIGGFGSSLFFIPIASYFLDFHTVLGVTAIFHVSSNVTKIAFFRKGFDRKLVVSMGIPAVICVIAGAYLSKWVDEKILELSLGLFLVIVSTTLLMARNFVLKPTPVNSISGGALSGFAAGLLGTGGAIRGIVLAAFNLNMDVFIATSAIIDLGIDSSRSVVYYLNGYMHKDLMYVIPLLLLTSILGTFLGKMILNRVSEHAFRAIVLALVFITGVLTLLKIAVGFSF